MAKIYQVEDDPTTIRMLQEVYGIVGHEVVFFSTVNAFEQQIEADRKTGDFPNLTIADGETPDSARAAERRLDAAQRTVHVLDEARALMPVVVYSQQINGATPWRSHDVQSAFTSRTISGVGKNSGMPNLLDTIDTALSAAAS